METTKNNDLDTLKETCAAGRLLTQDYTEADIEWLEGQDLTEPGVLTALQSAYEQNDPNERGFVGFRASPWGYSVGSEAELRQVIDEANKVLMDNPKQYDARMRRLMARAGLALQAKVKSEKAAAMA